MKSPAQSLLHRRADGFTLVEMMVSVAMLSVLVFLLMTIMNSTSATVGTSWSRLQSDQDGRLVLDRLQIDLQNMLLRPDIDYEFVQNTGNDKLAYYATEPGYNPVPKGTTGKRVASIIVYKMVNSASGQPMLGRGANDGFQWAGSSGAPSVPPMIFTTTPQLSLDNSTITPLETTTPDTLSPNIFRFEISFLLKNPTNAAAPKQSAPALVASLPKHTPIANVAAIIVTLAEIDSQNAKVIPPGSWSKLVAALPDAGGASTAQAWNAAIASPNFATIANIPPKAASAVRVYERYFYLNSTP
jgi:prepilin-type N-terminal cleavage/methylation domain-containing protein